MVPSSTHKVFKTSAEDDKGKGTDPWNESGNLASVSTSHNNTSLESLSSVSSVSNVSIDLGITAATLHSDDSTGVGLIDYFHFL